MPRSLLPLLAIVVAVSMSVTTSSGASADQTPPAIVRISGSGSVIPLMRKLADAYRLVDPHAQVEFVPGRSSRSAVEGLHQGLFDIGVVSRTLSPADRASGIVYHGFGKDAIAFVIRLPNRVASLTGAQLRGIYGGRITDWREVGGAPGAIIVLDRDEGDSARRLGLLPLLLGKPVGARTVVLRSAGAMRQALAQTPGSIGYLPTTVMRADPNPLLRILALDGRAPTAADVAAGRYPIHLQFGMICNGHPSVPAARFMEFVFSDAGRRLLARYDVVPIRS